METAAQNTRRATMCVKTTRCLGRRRPLSTMHTTYVFWTRMFQGRSKSHATFRQSPKRFCDNHDVTYNRSRSYTIHSEIMVKAQLDTGGSQNLASRELLQNINTTGHYQRLPMKMITVNGDTPRHTTTWENFISMITKETQ